MGKEGKEEKEKNAALEKEVKAEKEEDAIPVPEEAESHGWSHFFFILFVASVGGLVAYRIRSENMKISDFASHLPVQIPQLPGGYNFRDPMEEDPFRASYQVLP